MQFIHPLKKQLLLEQMGRHPWCWLKWNMSWVNTSHCLHHVQMITQIFLAKRKILFLPPPNAQVTPVSHTSCFSPHTAQSNDINHITHSILLNELCPRGKLMRVSDPICLNSKRSVLKTRGRAIFFCPSVLNSENHLVGWQDWTATSSTHSIRT